MPRLALLALTLAVLLVHGWLLQAAPRVLGVGQTAASEKTMSFVTRTVATLPAAAAPSAQPPVASTPRATQTVRPKAPQVANQLPAAALASVGESPAPETEPVAEQTLPEAVTDNAAAEAAPAVAVTADQITFAGQVWIGRCALVHRGTLDEQVCVANVQPAGSVWFVLSAQRQPCAVGIGNAHGAIGVGYGRLIESDPCTRCPSLVVVIAGTN